MRAVLLGCCLMLSNAVAADAYHWLLPDSYQSQPTDSVLSINFKNPQQVLLNLTFHVDDEWREVPAETMRDEFIDGLLAVPGVKSGRRFVLKLPAQALGKTQIPARDFYCQDWQGPGNGGKQIGRICVLAQQALRVVVSLNSPSAQATSAAEDYQLALSSLSLNWDALVLLRDSQP
jgi:hypothetical protein